MLRILLALFLVTFASSAARASEADVRRLIALMAHNPSEGSLCHRLSGRPSSDEMECKIGDTKYSVRYRRLEHDNFFGKINPISRYPMLTIATGRDVEGGMQIQRMVDKRADGTVDIGESIHYPPLLGKREDDSFRSHLGGCSPEEKSCGKQHGQQWQELYDLILPLLIAQLEKK